MTGFPGMLTEKSSEATRPGRPRPTRLFNPDNGRGEDLGTGELVGRSPGAVGLLHVSAFRTVDRGSAPAAVEAAIGTRAKETVGDASSHRRRPGPHDRGRAK